jgi:hypothetical protein
MDINDEVATWFVSFSTKQRNSWDNALNDSIKQLTNAIDQDFLNFYIKRLKYMNQIACQRKQRGSKFNGKQLLSTQLLDGYTKRKRSAC